MKKFLAAFAVMTGMMILAGEAMAALTDTIVLHVTPNVNKSVNIDATDYSFGVQNLGANDILSASATVTNDGNFVNTYSLTVDTTGGGWSAGAASGIDTYHLAALFNDSVTPPLAASFNDANDTLIEDTEVIANGTLLAGNQTGTGINPAATQGLWFLLDMPSGTSVTGVQDFTVTIEVQ